MARKAYGMTQGELAKALDVDRSTVNQWEKGNRYPDQFNMPRVQGVVDADLVPMLGWWGGTIGIKELVRRAYEADMDLSDEAATALAHRTAYARALVQTYEQTGLSVDRSWYEADHLAPLPGPARRAPKVMEYDDAISVLRSILEEEPDGGFAGLGDYVAELFSRHFDWSSLMDQFDLTIAELVKVFNEPHMPLIVRGLAVAEPRIVAQAQALQRGDLTLWMDSDGDVTGVGPAAMKNTLHATTRKNFRPATEENQKKHAAPRSAIEQLSIDEFLHPENTGDTFGSAMTLIDSEIQRGLTTRRIRRAEDEDLRQLNVLLLEEERAALKKYAADRGTSVSELVRALARSLRNASKAEDDTMK